MQPITIKTQTKRFKPEIGEFPFDQGSLIYSKGLFDLLDTGFSMFPLIFNMHYNPFVTLRRLGLQIQDAFVRYNCPFNTNNTYYGIVPIGIETKKTKLYRQEEFSDNSYDYVFDLNFQAKYIHQYLREVDDITSCFLGHGYDDSRLPFDGSIKIVNVKLELSNGDFIIAKTFEWYNK